MEIIAAFCEIYTRTKHMNAVWQKVEYFNDKPDGTYSNRWA
jgi:hypothetical protein